MQPTLYAPSPTIQRSLREYTANGCTFYMVAIEKGSFLMKGDHKITFQEDFEMGQYPVTQALWEAVMGESPYYFKGKNRPVELVSWDDIREEGGFLDRLNALPEIAALNEQDDRRFALPSEAQWEYAAWGGRYGAAFPYEFTGSNYLPEVGWYDENSQQQTQPLGRKLPNALGLYDMSGNVWEWCEDVWNDNYKDAPKDGSARVTGKDKRIRLLRGGSWSFNVVNSRVSYRKWYFGYYGYSYWGFRLSRYRLTP